MVLIFIFVLAAVSACPCPAGTHCLNGNTNDCRPCEDNKYQDEQITYALYCADCSPSCRQKEIVVKNCSKSNDLICQCEPGYYKAPGLNGPCLPHNSCKAGFEEKLPGNHINDTVCIPCASGKYRTAESQSKSCVPCTRCAESEKEESPCSGSKDTVCRAKSGLWWIIGVVVGAVFVLVVIFVCLHRKGYIPCWGSKESEKKRPESEQHPLHEAESPTVQMNGTHRSVSSESNGVLRDKIDSTSSTGSDRHRWHSGSTSPTEERSEFQSFILKICQDLASRPDWKMFMRSLIGDGVDTYINTAQLDNPNNTQEQIYQVFWKWKSGNPEAATKESVIKELKNYGWNLIAANYENIEVTEA